MTTAEGPMIYTSARGRITEAVLVRETAKGYRVKRRCNPNTYRTREYVVYVQCPHGNHRSFTSEKMAVIDARLWISKQRLEARRVLVDMQEREDSLKQLAGVR